MCVGGLVLVHDELERGGRHLLKRFKRRFPRKWLDVAATMTSRCTLLKLAEALHVNGNHSAAEEGSPLVLVQLLFLPKSSFRWLKPGRSLALSLKGMLDSPFSKWQRGWWCLRLAFEVWKIGGWTETISKRLQKMHVDALEWLRCVERFHAPLFSSSLPFIFFDFKPSTSPNQQTFELEER